MKMKIAGDILDANVIGWGGGKRKRPRARARRLSNGKLNKTTSMYRLPLKGSMVLVHLLVHPYEREQRYGGSS